MNEFWTDVFSALGLAFTGVGAFLAARSVILSKKDALNIGIGAWAGETDEENEKLPIVQNLIKSSKGARRGLWLVVFGTVLQITPVVFRLVF